MHAYKAAIFDWNGTLTNTKKAVMEPFKKVLGEVGSIASDRFTERSIGTGTRKALEAASKASDVKLYDETFKNFLGKG